MFLGLAKSLGSWLEWRGVGVGLKNEIVEDTVLRILSTIMIWILEGEFGGYMEDG